MSAWCGSRSRTGCRCGSRSTGAPASVPALRPNERGAPLRGTSCGWRPAQTDGCVLETGGSRDRWSSRAAPRRTPAR